MDDPNPQVEQKVLRALDDLFVSARAYRSSPEFKQLIEFVAGFRFYSPYNAMLVHIQRPGATFVCPAYRWKKEFDRNIKPGATPLIILQPMGPVMFVFDVSDTEPGPDAPPLPEGVTNPFKVRYGKIGSDLERTIENAKRDGIEIITRKEGSQSAGSIMTVPWKGQKPLVFQTGIDKQRNPVYRNIPVQYRLLLNEDLSRESRYATMTHELGHLYCGHLGTPNPKWWPDRRGRNKTVKEFEAEAVSYLVCTRQEIESPSDSYLSGYLKYEPEIPPISPEAIMKSAGLIEQMGRKRMKMRKE